MNNRIFDKTVSALSKSLDLRAQKQAVLASNIANAQTPGYQAKAFEFEQELARALNLDEAPMQRSATRHLASGGAVEQIKPQIYNDPNNVVRQDGNTVDRDKEMMRLAENQLLYNASTEMIRKKLAFLKYAITEGNK